MHTNAFSLQWARRASPVALLSALLVGCAHVPNDHGLAEVQAAAQSRATTELTWSGADDAVHALLEAPLTPESAAQIALLRSPESVMAFAELGISRADMIEAGTLSNPSIGALARFPLDGGSGTLLDLDGGFPLLDALMLPMQRKLEEDHFERAKLLAADRVLELVSAARVAWYETVAAQLEQTVLADSQEAAAAAADFAGRQYDAGNLSRLERLGHESLAIRTRLEARALDAEAAGKEQTLRRTLGLHPGDPQWLLMPMMPAPSPFVPGAAALEEVALQNRLDIAAANQNIEAMQRALRLTKRFRFTGIDVGVSAEREFDGEWSLGPSIDVELPLFDRKRGAVMRFESLVALATAERDALEAAIRAEVATLAAQLHAAAESAITYQNELLPLHRDLVAETQLHYNGMLVGVYDLLNAKQAELEVQRGAIRAQLDYWRARTELERALAGALPESGTGTESPVDTDTPATPPAEATHEQHEHEKE
jgi:cobalt-zinc-cadmium efflux system outer membrane protein